MRYTAQELASMTNSRITGNKNEVVEQLIFDSRLIFSSKNNAFIALKTQKSNGSKYIKEAIEKGIKVIIADEIYESSGQDITWIITSDTQNFLRQLAHHHLQNLNIKTIGITGSNGKTIVKEWLYQCLWDEMRVVKSPKSYNSQIGLPLSILQANNNDELGIFEVGISKPHEMEKQSEVFSPQIGVFTHLGSAHSEYFENEEQLLNEKLKLFEKSEVIIYNGDHPLVKSKIQILYNNKTLISYGLGTSNDILIESPIDQKEAFNIKLLDGHIQIPFTNRDQATLHNALAVIAVLNFLKIPHLKIVDKINNLQAVEMRMESIKGERDNLIINDSYNLDLDSLKIALSTLNQYGNKSQKVLVLTDIHDVKDNSEHLYHTVAGLVNEHSLGKIYLIGTEITKFSHLFNSKTFSFDNIQELIEDQEFNSIENSLILLKGARKFELENLKKELELQSHDTVLEVNLNAILHNINVHRNFLKPETKMMAMVKAYSYGLGGYEIAEFLQHHNINYLGVAYADEGVDLRKNKVTLPIMVMNPELNSYDTIIDYQLEPEIYSFKVLDLFLKALRKKGIHEKYPIHIKLETGMHRLGFRREDLDELLLKIKENNLRIASIFTHLSSADDPEEREYTLAQIKLYTDNSDYILARIEDKPLRHCLNSPGITNYSEYQFDMVRIGIGMIGYTTNPAIQPLLQSAVCFKTVITQISPLHPGESLGYNRRFKATNDTNIATIAVGYADGIPRLLSNGKGFVGIKGKLYPIQGTVCMDMLMVDIGNDPIEEGDDVIIFNGNPSLEKFAEYCQTIPYEVLTSVSRRVKRIYIKD
ncbi:bifunctional UDP-N-acetylmuramoyl-tripeptide:D-alanyl-D-alanine ligase/alanine racemase [Elizabethkingia miricola]|uniref:bifunctional UDP-N-acetylmuramoyl-tripeptide:D-alanyl-D-alanine ligase/alanine racemase n=1 Tax=Elizabethkingia miricola TaxID=172045 RepID=UPI00099B115A|nr:bifunctional UDP-N-acetylmuramoyl-tripeptide:D-alanyl-D-alanine ligase/alanine racemase [Elizabethkingia miricola]MCL1679758.1 bifunctional UDP-N-acetylmuramoyl-tripeptide:D-alanyl-D-alanine ligase/alanine racemase [Elizabethkingia miricola]OPC40385.1 bifunctional UDP-N-acetylmuramoyl-tripeptide:D-alanyl-D-alanine ligase/alanine racemase [Elizabethkingia miricola]